MPDQIIGTFPCGCSAIYDTSTRLYVERTWCAQHKRDWNGTAVLEDKEYMHYLNDGIDLNVMTLVEFRNYKKHAQTLIDQLRFDEYRSDLMEFMAYRAALLERCT